MRNIDDFIDQNLKKTPVVVSDNFADAVISRICAEQNADAALDELFKPRTFKLDGFCDRVMSAIAKSKARRIFAIKTTAFFSATAAAASLMIAGLVFFNGANSIPACVVTESDYAKMSDILDEINTTYVLLAQESILDL